MRTTVILPDELYRQVKEAARARGRTVTSFMEEALQRELARRDSSLGPVDVHLAPPSGSRDSRPLVDLTDKEAVWAALDEGDFAVQQIRASHAADRHASER
ncbi:ribbon-helix-helix protein, CopG family [Microbacterium sp. C7(2022)]|uniref:ribbon-helix-helix domain-containing protein n=1 Tax=Microbacterium sp. C7(2022) TaxID=2992759 RepID=UPI00237C4F9C|nr:ribbon-helix-helix protein, CopG family [Microbacterium sp. C7(2022)]MDE0547457.1 ribbon-helix-helix protein, CopG family [Microbacterium sp. C7(2022)]